MSIATASSNKPALDIASAALANMSVFEKRAAEARAELEAHPRVFVSRLVSDVKRLAAADALAEHFLLGALPRDVLEAVAGALAVAPVEEGQVLNGPYGWGSDAVAVVAGAVRATYPGGPGAWRAPRRTAPAPSLTSRRCSTKPRRRFRTKEPKHSKHSKNYL